MSQSSTSEAQTVYDAVRKALSSWGKQNAEPETLLDHLLAVQAAQEALNAGDNPALLRAATNQVLKDAIEDLEKQNARPAKVLRLRFAEKQAIQEVAHAMNFSTHQISRMQRDGIEQLVEILQGREQDIKRTRAQSLESLLPPPTFSRLQPSPRRWPVCPVSVRSPMRTISRTRLYQNSRIGGIGAPGFSTFTHYCPGSPFPLHRVVRFPSGSTGPSMPAITGITAHIRNVKHISFPYLARLCGTACALPVTWQ